MERKFLDQTGVQRLVEKLSEHMDSGGGGNGGEAGRIKLHGTVENPVNLDEILEPNSYLISGVVEGLPEEINDELQQVEDMEMEIIFFFDVNYKIHLIAEEEGETYESALFVQEFRFMNIKGLSPSIWQRIYFLEEEFFTEWESTVFRGLTDAIVEYIGQGADFLVEQSSPTHYRIIIANIPENAYVTDLIMKDDFIDMGGPIYPCSTLNVLRDTLRINQMGEFYRADDYFQFEGISLFKVGDIYFNSEADATAFTSMLGNMQAYLVYQTRRLLID